MGTIVCPETSVLNFHYSLRNKPEKGSSYLFRGGSLKSFSKIDYSKNILSWENTLILSRCEHLSNGYLKLHFLILTQSNLSDMLLCINFNFNSISDLHTTTNISQAMQFKVLTEF